MYHVCVQVYTTVILKLHVHESVCEVYLHIMYMHFPLCCIKVIIIYIMYNICNSCVLFCHPKYSILYGALIIFVVGSGQRVSSSPATTVTWLMLFVVSC